MPSMEAQLVAVAALLVYAMATALAMIDGRRPRKSGRRVEVVLLAGGIGLGLALLALRLSRGHLPAASGFDTFAFLALLSGVGAAYLGAVGALPAARAWLLPVAAACSVLAVALSGAAYHGFARDVWGAAHVTFAVAAAVSFAAAAGGGWLYLRKHKQLRAKDPAVLHWRLPPLERLARFVRHALPVSFALITATMVTGLVGAMQPRHEGYLLNWWTHPKVLTATITWCVYTVALHAAYTRRVRVRTAAILSAAGFLLLIAVLVGSMLLPKT